MKKYFKSVEIFDEDPKTNPNNNWLLIVKK